MNEDTSFCHQLASRHGIGSPFEARNQPPRQNHDRQTDTPNMAAALSLVLAMQRWPLTNTISPVV